MEQRTLAGLVGALAAAATGLLVVLRADAMATHWHALSEGGWGGAVDLSLAGNYRLLGIILSAFALILSSVCAARFLGRPDPDDTRSAGSRGLGGGWSALHGPGRRRAAP